MPPDPELESETRGWLAKAVLDLRLAIDGSLKGMVGLAN